jgi:hypothetical protein
MLAGGDRQNRPGRARGVGLTLRRCVTSSGSSSRYPCKAGFRRLVVFALSGICLAAFAAAQPYQYTVTNISAMAFQPAASGQEYFMSGSAGRFIPANEQQFFWTALTLPPGAIVDYIGINNVNDGTPLVVGAALYERDQKGFLTTAAAVRIHPTPSGRPTLMTRHSGLSWVFRRSTRTCFASNSTPARTPSTSDRCLYCGGPR